ncbi:unnamed protein product [Phaedon cochleariae]|uniref:Epoxide hydrolase n=1 Tax=Phaedon cochleariae TaxID=80249 RepID=A0A9P0DRL5_PHACE|nr:unnamed protein product [Phaedon cochleariae]
MVSAISITALLILGLGVLMFTKVRPLLEVPPIPKIEETWWGPGQPGKSVDTSIRPFKINVPDEVIRDLHRRLDSTLPFQPPLEGSKQHYGMNTDLLKNITEFWKTKYDWRERETFLNRYPQFKVNVQGLNIHYIHVKPAPEQTSKGVRVLPLLLLHGWPESVSQFNEIIPLLTTAQKGKDFVFEVIAPSLPGFGFSDAAIRPGLGAIQMAIVMKNLMERIGINRYYVQGGDWGGAIVRAMAVLHSDKLLGVHSSMCFSNSPLSYLKLLVYSFYPSWIVDKGHEDLVYPLTDLLMRSLLETGYMHIQITKPDTVGVALRESPVGLAAYILEKFTTLTNPSWKDLEDGGLHKKFTITKLLDNIMIYWVTRSITTSMRLYSETFNKTHMSMKLDRIPITKVPTGCARFRHDLWYMPETILRDKYANMVHLRDYDAGHFAAFEVPDTLSRDVFDFVETVEELNRA